MALKVIASTAVVLLALSAGVAYAATQGTAADETSMCVNTTNGLVRVDTTCRDNEYPLTLGGGGSDVRVTQAGPSTLTWGTTGAGVTLPLTGVTVAPKCELVTSPPAPPGTPDIGLARLLITTSGTMTAFTGNAGSGSGGTIDGQSLLTIPATTASGTGVNYGIGPTTIATANGATATITFGAQANAPNRTCTFLWQAVEAPN